MTWGHWYWPTALLSCSAILGIPELIALFTNRLNTLSDYSWDELRVGSIPANTVAWYVSLVLFLLAVAILVPHIWWRWG